MKAIKVLVLSCLIGASVPALAQKTPTSQMEKLSRGLVVIPSSNSSGEFVSWRLLGTDNASTTTFDVIRNGTTIAKNLKNVTSYLDKNGNSSSKYQVAKRVNGVITETTSAVTPWSNTYKTLKLSRPGSAYSPNDCSVADVDGDGEYELIVKWDPSDAKDNSQSGKTSAVFIDCYEFTGTRLWRIDLGYNIRAGAHYTQFLAYDFNGDGKAEIMCKTAPLSKDGKGNYVTAAATDSNIKNASQTNYRNSNGYILSGPEYLTVFNGQTGAAIHTVWYNPNRAGGYGAAAEHPAKSFWGDNYGNRCDRYLACVAYLDGASSTPSAVFCRGYYTRAYLWAVKFDGRTISTKWLSAHTSKTSVTLTNSSGSSSTKTYSSSTSGKGSYTLFGNGNHNLSVADVDGDGRDEILYGSGALDHDGSLLYATGMGHGDAIHVSDFAPDRNGLEVFQVHEESPYGWDLHDAATGKILYSSTGNSDNGRGIAGCFIAGQRGGQMTSSNDRSLRSCANNSIVSSKSSSMNFRIYWDGSLYDQLFDKTVTKHNGSSVTTLFTPANYNSSTTCNGTKATPCLQADIFGDWREEIIMWSSSDNATLNIFSTTETTSNRVPTLMHDHVYRMGVAWQNVAYNQPPHLGYYLPDYAASFNANSSITAVDNNNTSATGYIQWNYNGGTLSQSATFSGLSGFVTGSVSKGSELTVSGTKSAGGLTETLLGVTSKSSSASSNSTITFTVNPVSGYTFQATKVEVTATRFGTDGGKLDFSFAGKSLATAQTPCRNSVSPFYTTYTYNLSGSSTTSAQAFVMYLYALATNKQYGICNIRIYGTAKSSSASAKGVSQFEAEETDEATAIEEVNSETPKAADDAYYNMNGMRVNESDLRPGTLYLHKGRKYIKR